MMMAALVFLQIWVPSLSKKKEGYFAIYNFLRDKVKIIAPSFLFHNKTTKSHVTDLLTCKQCEKSYDLMILVSVDVKDFDGRNTIRFKH